MGFDEAEHLGKVAAEHRPQRSEHALLREPGLQAARAGQRDEALAGEQLARAAFAALAAAAPGAEYAVDVTLEHRRRGAEPDRVDEHVDVGLAERDPLALDIGRGLAFALLRLEHRVELEAVEIADHDLVPASLDRLGVFLGESHREALLERMADDDRMLDGFGHGAPQ